MSTLEIKDLTVSVNTEDGAKEILKGVTLTINSGETHAIMGPNGSGKSTLAYSIAGHPKYTITGGTVTLDGEDVLEMSVDERARAGVFLAMQYPVEVPGVSVSNFLRTSATAVRGEAPKLRTWVKEVKGAMEQLQMDPAFAERNVNEGFSGGEKKRHEILQLELLHRGLDLLHPGTQLRGLAADGGGGGAQEVGDRDAGDLDRVLHGQEDAGAGALVDRHLQDVLAVEGDGAAGDRVLRVAGQRVRQGRLAGAVRAHDGVGLALLDGQVDTLEDLPGAVLGLDGDVQVVDFKRCHG